MCSAAGPSLTLQTAWCHPSLVGSSLSFWETSPTSPHLTPLASAHPAPAHACREESTSPTRTACGTRGGSNKTLCSEAGHDLTFILPSSSTKSIYKKGMFSCLFFIKRSTKFAFACMHTGPGAGIFLYFSSLCLLLKPS